MEESRRNSVLIAEDDQDSGDLLQYMLSREGIAAELVRDSFQAMEYLRRESPEVLITDIHMPGKSGIDLIREIREREAAADAAGTLPIIAMSVGRGDELLCARDAGADRWCDKHDLLSLVNRVKELMRRHLAPPVGARPAAALG